MEGVRMAHQAGVRPQHVVQGAQMAHQQVSDHTMLSMAQDMQQGRIHEMSWQFVCWICGSDCQGTESRK